MFTPSNNSFSNLNNKNSDDNEKNKNPFFRSVQSTNSLQNSQNFQSSLFGNMSNSNLSNTSQAPSLQSNTSNSQSENSFFKNVSSNLSNTPFNQNIPGGFNTQSTSANSSFPTSTNAFGSFKNSPSNTQDTPSSNQFKSPISPPSFNTQQSPSNNFNQTSFLTPNTSNQTQQPSQPNSFTFPGNNATSPINSSNIDNSKQQNNALDGKSNQFSFSSSLPPVGNQEISTGIDRKKADLTILDGSGASFVNSIRESSSMLYNKTLKEIIEIQEALLKQNISEFKDVASKILEQDLKLFGERNRLIHLQDSINKEEKKMNELEEGLDFFVNELERKIQNKNTVEGVFSSKTSVIKDFEDISDKFYSSVRGLGDEKTAIMDLLDQNYELIEKLDEKMDSMDSSNKLF